MSSSKRIPPRGNLNQSTFITPVKVSSATKLGLARSNTVSCISARNLTPTPQSISEDRDFECSLAEINYLLAVAGKQLLEEKFTEYKEDMNEQLVEKLECLEEIQTDIKTLEYEIEKKEIIISLNNKIDEIDAQLGQVESELTESFEDKLTWLLNMLQKESNKLFTTGIAKLETQKDYDQVTALVKRLVECMNRILELHEGKNEISKLASVLQEREKLVNALKHLHDKVDGLQTESVKLFLEKACDMLANVSL